MTSLYFSIKKHDISICPIANQLVTRGIYYIRVNIYLLLIKA